MGVDGSRIWMGVRMVATGAVAVLVVSVAVWRRLRRRGRSLRRLMWRR